MISKCRVILLAALFLSLFCGDSLAQKKMTEAQLQREIRRTELEIKLQQRKNELDRLRKEAETISPADTANGGDTDAVPAVIEPVPLGDPAPVVVTAVVVPAVVPAAVVPQQNNCATVFVNRTAQTRLDEATCVIIDKASTDVMNGVANNKIKANLVSQQIIENLAAQLAEGETARAFFLESERQRTDKQVGATPNSAGTTSLVVKGGTPALIGWAVEQGAATSAVNGNTVTVRFNPLNLGKSLFYNQGILELKEIKERQDPFDSFLRNLSFGVSFDTSRNTDTPVFNGKERQVSAVSFRYEFINNRNPLTPQRKKERDAFFLSQEENLNKIARSIKKIVVGENNEFVNAALNKWVDETNVELAKIPVGLTSAARKAQVGIVINSQLKKLPIDELKNDKELKDALRDFTEGSIGFKTGTEELIKELNKGAVATFEYTNFREPIAPDTSNFRFIWEKGVFSGVDFTFNASLTMYNKKPAVVNVRRIRDFQFAVQLDKSLKNTFGLGNSVLSFAGRYERLNGDTVNALGIVTPNTKGDIGFGQVKLTIPIGDTGIRLPISATFSNRTELIKEADVRGNFGITFDLDPLFARFKPF